MNIFENPWRFTKSPIRWLRRFIKSFKYLWQRATKGYCDEDLWNLDSYLAKLLGSALKELYSNTCSYPYRLETHEEWQIILAEISDHFYMTLEDSYDTPCLDAWCDSVDDYFKWKSDEFTEEQKMLREKMREENKYISEERDRHKDEALKMLSEYWFDLWD